MDLAATISIMNFRNVQQQVAISVANLAQNMVETDSANLVQLMEQSVNPNVGSNIDIRV